MQAAREESRCGQMRKKIKAIKSDESLIGQVVEAKAWVRTIRDQKKFAFVEINDGSSFSGLQVVLTPETEGYESFMEQASTGASVAVVGELVQSPGSGQSVEIKASKAEVIGRCSEDYPLQKKRHSFEFLRSIAHLRPRSNTFGAVTRVRNALAMATHEFFQNEGFLYLNTPIITGSDCEGAGEMFKVSTLGDNPPRTQEGKVDYSVDFFEKPTFLTVSGQLNAEAYACALSDVYTFGPTFRAENSNTSRHLAEFWMIEPEMAFADYKDNAKLAEKYMKFVLAKALESCREDMAFFDQFIEKGLVERLEKVVKTPFKQITYTEAIEELLKAKKKFEFPIEWGKDLQSEHERYLCEEVYQGPVIVRDYPKGIKAFYMRLNDDDKTVAAMDVLVPGVGEIIGGAQREERYEILEARLKEAGLDAEGYQWYADLRRYGTVPHCGFGVGFERLVKYVTGMENIRDVIAFPRYPGGAEF